MNDNIQRKSLTNLLCDDPYNNSELSNEMFWGTSEESGLYLHYNLVPNHSIVTSTGITESVNRMEFFQNDCDAWLSEFLGNIIPDNRLFIIQGYAGSGKTIFVERMCQNNSEQCFYVDVTNYCNIYNERLLIHNVLVSFLKNKILKPLNEKKKLFSILNQIKDWNYRFNFDIFSSDLATYIAMIDDIQEQVKNKKCDKGKFFIESFTTKLLLHESNIKQNEENNFQNPGTYIHNEGNIPAIMSLILLFQCILKNSNLDAKYIFILDNLDIISDPSITAECAVAFWTVIQRYDIFIKENYAEDIEWPKFRLIMTARKVLFSHLAAHLGAVEQTHQLQNLYCWVCDISNLYSSDCIASHRIKYWEKRTSIDSKTRDDFNRVNQILSFLDNFAPNQIIYENSGEPLNSFNLDAFSNHNYRAFSNLLDLLVHDNTCRRIFNNCDSYVSWMRTATLLFAITKIYKNVNGKNIWETLGYACNHGGRYDYPTTLNRLLLNYMYSVRILQNNPDFTLLNQTIPGAISLSKLISSLSKVKFVSATRNENLNTLYQNTDEANTRKMIIRRLAEMCSRNLDDSRPYGYDENDKELWRRPAYFKGGAKLYRTAASIADLENFFTQASNDSSQQNEVWLSITDEGCIIIKNLVIHFEFYSARLGDDKSDSMKPLHQAINNIEIDQIIQPVFLSLKQCCTRNRIFREAYTKAYDCTIDEYVKQPFHALTHFSLNDEERNEPRTQLHMIRVIYSHIGYFNSFKDYLFRHKPNLDSQNTHHNREMRVALTKWINEYLKLYKDHFFDIIKITSKASDNNVYNKLNDLCKKQFDIFNRGNDDNISIHL